MCEGTKIRRDKRWKNSFLSPIEVTNTDPKIIKIFVDFLIKDLKISQEKLRGQIQIHEGDNKQEIEKFWSRNTNISISQFNKTIIRKVGNKPGKSKGTFKVRVYDKALFKKMKIMLDNELKEISSGV